MRENGTIINARTAVSLGLVLTLLGALVASAATWGKMQAQLEAKLDRAEAERDFVREAELSRQLDSIEGRLVRMEEKLDRALAEGAAGVGRPDAAMPPPAREP